MGQNKWFSVYEKLPKNGQRVIVYTPLKEMAIGTFYYNDLTDSEFDFFLLQEKGLPVICLLVTHWRKLIKGPYL